MEGKKVKVHLHTHILVVRPGREGSGPEEQAVQSLSGKVKHMSEGGVFIEVFELVGDRGEAFAPPFSELFLPHHKIDHIFLA